MTYDEWTPRFARLMTAFGKSAPGESERCAAYYEALQGYSEGVIEQVIAKAIANERYLPPAAVLRTYAAGIIAGAPYTPSECALCHGTLWVEAPDEQHFGLTYTNYVRRCPRCRPQPAATAVVALLAVVLLP